MTKDYYKILEISEFSNIDDIKKAYRKLARKYHPDVAGNTAEIVTRFKEINEAYNVLSNSKDKANYDSARKFYNYAKDGASSKSRTTQNNTKPNNTQKKQDTKKTFWDDFFNYQNSKKDIQTPKRGKDIFTDVEISALEAITGTSKTINMLQSELCPKCGGRKFVNGTHCSHCHGKGEFSVYKKFNVKIPAGILDKSKIRLSEEGEQGINGGKNGDLYLTVHIKENKKYKVDGLNILKTIYITPYEAVLGANVKVATLTGNVSLKINPHTRSGQKIRLSECGLEQSKKIGDMIVTVEIQIPHDISEEEIELYKKLQQISSKVETTRERLD